MATEQAKKVAKHIIEDRHGADYYQDTKILAQYLEGALDMTPEEAERTAKAIQEDRGGANYYENPEILADFLQR